MAAASSEEVFDRVLNKVTSAETRDQVIAVFYSLPITSSIFVATVRALHSLVRRRTYISAHEFLLFVLVIASLLIITTPTAFVVTSSALLRPKPYCGAVWEPAVRAARDTRFYLLNTGKPVRGGWLLRSSPQPEDRRMASEDCLTGLLLSNGAVLESREVVETGYSSEYSHRNLTLPRGGAVPFTRGRFYFVSDCLDVERAVARLLAGWSPISCTTGFLHSDQLSFTQAEDT